MAEYTWKQWGQTQDNDNVINQANCERWQAGIELAGGSWSGSFEDGKDSITIDEFNALESQIQSKVSSYTPKGYDPDSTVQIVPGPDGWNKVEDGLIKAICQPDGVNRNWLQNTRSLALATSKITQSGSIWSLSTDENGYEIASISADDLGQSSANYPAYNFITSKVWTADEWADKDFVVSMDIIGDTLTKTSNADFSLAVTMWGSNNGTSWTRWNYTNNSLFGSATSIITFNSDEIINDEWFRLIGKFKMPKSENFNSKSSTAFTYFRYGLIVYHNNTTTGSFAFSKPKLEIADEVTDWSYAPEDFGWPDDTEL